MTFKIKDWTKFQHYKNRRPPWIRLYRDILEDPDFYEMSGDDFKILAMLWLIASEDPNLEGELPASKKLAFRLRISEAKLSQALLRLNHWIINDASNALAGCLQVATPDQTRSESDQSTDQIKEKYIKEKKVTGAHCLPDDWEPNDKHRAIARQHGINIDWEAAKIRDWATAKGSKKKNWERPSM